MAISPKEADNHLTEIEKKEIKEQEIQIDTNLRNGDRYYNINNLDSRIVNKLIKIYENVGWIVTHKTVPGEYGRDYLLQFEKHEGELMS